ncbi:LCP family protein [Baaleninema simplex]|uniref:LCP family protein n=1 Tax=Baaleninema simplex TaxID=2862350 RepID=UPI001FE1C0A9|nr:LCP family protein [Baaleninema simplex]
MKVSPSRPGNVSALLWWSVIATVTILTSAILGAVAALVMPASSFVRSPWRQGRLWDNFGYELSRPVNILVLGVDRDPEIADDSPNLFRGRSDTVLVMHFDPNDDSLNVVSVPRDTQVELPDYGVAKLNQANAIGGVALAEATVRGLTNDLSVDRYVRVNTEALVELVDMLGGVEVFVPYPMSYLDRTQQLVIDLDPGWQLLDGRQAQQFSRFRQGRYGDVGRVQRQQILIEALRDRLTNPTVIPRIPAIVRVMQKYVDTNLTLEEMVALAGFGVQLDPQQFRMVLLPGRFSTATESDSSYWLIDTEQRDRIVAEFLDRTPSDAFIDRPSSQAAFNETPTRPRIAIQNASGDPQTVDLVRSKLQQLGFSEIYVAPNWNEVRRHTAIVVQTGDLEAARRLQGALGFGNIESLSTGDLDSDLTLRVGSDARSAIERW